MSVNTIGNWERGITKPQRVDEIDLLEVELNLSKREFNQLLLAAGMPTRYEAVELPPDATQQIKTGTLITDTLVVKRPVFPATYRIRPPNPRHDLLGRDEDVAWVKEQLRGLGGASIAGLRGIGGIGKTELAIHVVQALEPEFDGRILWLQCGESPIFSLQTQLALALGLNLEPAGQDEAARAALIKTALEKAPRCLVVFDDVREAHRQRFHLLDVPKPPHAMLVTSRRADVLPELAVRRLDVLNDTAATALLLNACGLTLSPPAESGAKTEGVRDDAVVEAEALKGILHLLENIPLALILVGRQIAKGQKRRKRPERPLTHMLAQLTAKRKEILGRPSDETQVSLRVSFDISYGELEEADQKRLRALGVLGRNSFSLEMLQVIWETAEAESVLNGASTLENMGLIEEIDDDVYWMHDVLRDYAAEWLKKEGEWTAASERQARLTQQFLGQIELRTLDDWQKIVELQPEIERAAVWLENSWGDHPQLAADLAIAMGNTLYTQTDTELVVWLRYGLKGAEKANADRDKAILQSSLADLLRTRGQYDEAERLYRLSLHVKEEIGDSRGVAVTQNSLGVMYFEKGDLAQAEEVLQAGLPIAVQAGDHQTVAGYFARLGQVDLAQGKKRSGIEKLLQAKQIFLQIGLDNWASQIDQLLRQAGVDEAQEQGITLTDIARLTVAARQQAEANAQLQQLCQALATAGDPNYAQLATALLNIVQHGHPYPDALAPIENSDLRQALLAELEQSSP